MSFQLFACFSNFLPKIGGSSFLNVVVADLFMMYDSKWKEGSRLLAGQKN